MENKANFIKRVLTALILLPIVLGINYIGGIVFDLFLFIILGISIFEVVNIVNKAREMSNYKKLIWIISISTYIIISILSLRYIRFSTAEGQYLIIYLLAFVSVFDSTAYFVGIAIGGPKLLPKISPKKTWSGLIGGMILTFVLSICAAKFMKEGGITSSSWTWTAIGVLIGLVGQVGDFMESYFKRKFGVKDSGKILPGHGGILDRLDSVFLGAIFFYLIIQLCLLLYL